MLRRALRVEKPLRRATAYLSGLGLSELYVNGAKAGDAVLSPAVSQYDKRVFYVTHDSTALLQPGENALGCGWATAATLHRATGAAGAPRAGFPKLLLQVHLDYADGTSEVVNSDAQWKLCTAGPIRANNEYDGEEYDARMEIAGWNAPGFDDSAWPAAAVVSAPAGNWPRKKNDRANTGHRDAPSGGCE